VESGISQNIGADMLKLKIFFCVMCSLCLFSKFTSSTIAGIGESNDAIRKDVLTYVRSIISYEYEVEDVDNTGKVRHLKYWQQGNMFRGESSIDTMGTWISTYNGERYQIFFKDRDVMSIKNTSAIPNPTRVTPPLIVAFSWLAKNGMTYSWMELTSEKNINEHFSKAKYIEEDSVNKEICSVLEFPGVIEGSTTRVWFSKEKKNFPVKMLLSSDGGNFAEVSINSFESVLSDDGVAILIPTNITGLQNFNRSKSVIAASTKVVPDSIIVNKKYDDDFFTLPTTVAKTVNDIDKLEAEGLLVPPVTVVATRRSLPVWFILANVLLISLLVYRLFLRRRV
jgi:hypothetical protein